MTFVLHQMRTDVRHLGGWLAAWLLLLLAATAFTAFRLDLLAGSRELVARLLGAHAFLLDALVLVGWVLAARIVHADPLDGTTAFWLTRPIAPARLAVAKLSLILVLFVAAPTALGALGAAGSGLRGAVLWRGWGEAALVHLGFILVIVLLASLTRDVARLVLATIVAAAAWVSLLVIVRAAASAQALDRELLRYSGLFAGLLACCAGCLAIALLQYLARNARRSAVAAVVLGVVIICLVDFWRWDILGLQPAVQTGSVDRVFRIGLRETGQAYGVGDGTYLRSLFVVEQAPAGWAVIPLHVDGELRLPNGTVLPFADHTMQASAVLYRESAIVAFGRQAFEATRLVLPGRWLNEPFPSGAGESPQARAGSMPVTVMKLPPGMSSPGPDRGAYQATVTCAAYHARIAARVPYREGAVLQLDDAATTILGARHAFRPAASDEVRVHVRTATLPLLFPRRGSPILHVLLNASRGEMLIGHDRSQAGPPLRLVSGSMQVRYGEIAFSAAMNRPLTLDPTWLSEAELAAVAFEPQEVFAQTVRIPDYPLAVAAPTAEKRR